MKIALALTFLLIGGVAMSQIPYSHPSGIYELNNTIYRKVETINYETMYEYDSISNKIDFSSVKYEIKQDNKLICKLTASIEDQGIRIITAYPDYSTKKSLIKRPSLQNLKDMYKYETSTTTIIVFKENGAVLIINYPIILKYNPYIIHMRPNTQ